MDRLSDLPQTILHKILYSVSQHQAAQTSALSKKWRYVWTTRPNVAFSDKAFNGTKQDFISTVNNTLQRYHHQNLSLDQFNFSLSDDESLSLLEEWIPRLTHMGVKEFYLSFASKSFMQEEYPPLPWLVFDAEWLQKLHVTRFKLDDRTAPHHHHHKINLKHLKLLHLDRVRIEDEEILHNIISSCPSIETLRLQDCDGLTRLELEDNLSNLKDLSFTGYRRLSQGKACSIKIQESPSIESIKIIESMIWFQPQELRNLNDLKLICVGFSVPDQLSWCKFPRLKFLRLLQCYGFEESHLFVDAPKIARFEYAGKFIPSISFATTSSSTNCATIEAGVCE